MKTKFIRKDNANWTIVAKEIGKADWGGAQHLSKKMKDNDFSDWEGVIYLEENKHILGFCTIVKKDIVEDLLCTPYIAVVYVFPEYRGKFLAKKLIKRAEAELKKATYDNVYLITELENFYEKMGYSKIDKVYDKFDRLMTLYHKKI